MRILVLGGTRVVGRGFVEAALRRGHTLTLFNRGLTNPERFPEVERIVGDRALGHSALRGRSWDAVYDASGYQPQQVADALKTLVGSIGFYAYVSTISVYQDPVPDHADEGALCYKPEPGGMGHYGQQKAACEAAVDAAMPGSSCRIRLGMVVGPYDDRDRFGGWLRRISQGGPMLAPGSPHAPAQVIDGRDAGDFALRLIEQRHSGAFNAVSPSYTLQHIFEVMREITSSDAVFVWMTDEWLKERGLVPWSGLPLWLSSEDHGFGRISADKALAAGLQRRSLAETVADAWAWERGRGLGAPTWLEREQALLAEWTQKHRALV